MHTKHTLFKYISIITAVATAMSCRLTAFAADTNLGTGVDIEGQHPANYTAYITAVLGYAQKVGVALATLMLIYAGYKYMTSQGNPTAVNEAKDIIIGSLSGLALLFLTTLLLSILGISS